MSKLTNQKVQKAAPGKYGDGDGLQLKVSNTGRKNWVFRYRLNERNREMGLGSYPIVSLSEARDLALEARKFVKQRIDPIDRRKIENNSQLFGDLVEEVFKQISPGFRSDKHRYDWKRSLEKYAHSLYHLPPQKITTEHVLRVLRPIWEEKRETAARLRGRIERILNAAKAKGIRSGDNPATWQGHLENLLARQSSHIKKHHAAMPYESLPEFIMSLQAVNGSAAMSLQFIILTSVRLNEAIGAKWSEVDFETRIWTIPAQRMKAAKQHCVPLSQAAIDVLERCSRTKDDDYIFPNDSGSKLTNAAVLGALRSLGIRDATVHGFRSSFRDWAGNETEYSRELAEEALAHVVGSTVERAYRRRDAIDKRRELMNAWAKYCCSHMGE